jgi:hypothetical protein
MSKMALFVIRITCLVVVGCFFLSYFVISCQGAEVNISGMEAAFGMDKENIPLDPKPMLFVIPVIALIVLLLLSVPSIRKKLENINSPIKIIPFSGIITILGGIIGIIMHIIAHNEAIGKIKSQMGGMGINISSIYHTGIGFKISVIAFIVLIIMPFVDKIILKKLE